MDYQSFDYESIAIIVCACVLIALIVREAFCWYFKINHRISLMRELINEQVKTNTHLTVTSKLGSIDTKGVK
jgi:hypothetical protein